LSRYNHISFRISTNTFAIKTHRKGGILIVKRKKTEPTDPHIKESYVAENREHNAPVPMPVAPTSVPMQLIAPIPVTTPSPTEAASAKNELLAINGVNEKTLLRLKKLGINNIDDLAKASAEHLTKELKVDLSTAQKWITRAKELQ
jgi:predicted flap endonuclease-1-like 5' DNA nuclease